MFMSRHCIITQDGQKFGIIQIFLLKEVCYAHQGCIYLIKIYSKINSIVKYYYNVKVSIF